MTADFPGSAIPSGPTPEGIAQLVRTRLSGDAVARNSAFIMVSTLATSLLGYVFWLVVAHTSSAEASGRGATVTSALQATALLASVGAAAAMVEWLPRAETELLWRQRLTVGLTVAVVTGLLGSVAVALLLGPGLNTLPTLRQPLGLALFCVGSVCFAVGTVLDYVSVAEGRSGLMLARNIVFNGLRTPILFVPVLIWRTSNEILASWAVSATVSLLAAVWFFERAPAGHRRLRLVFGHVRVHTREMLHSLVGQHLITIAALLVTYLLPIIVTIRLSSADGAYFYATWMLGSVFFMISPAVSTALFAEGAAGRDELARLVTRAGKVIAAMLTVPVVVYLVAGGEILRLFGADYARHGRWLLVLLTVSAVPDAVTNIAVSVLRATQRMKPALWLNSLMLALCVAGSWVLAPHLGIAAVGISWLASQSLGAAWVLVRWHSIVGVRTASPPAPVPAPRT